MKVKTLFIGIVMVLLFGVSCNKMTDPIVDYVIISGTLSNTQERTFKISALDYSKVISISETGTFKDTLFIENDGVFKLRESKKGKLSIYLTKGAEIQITADGKDFLNTLKFSGTHADLNNYFTYKAKKDNAFMANLQENFSKKETEFERFAKAFQDTLSQQLKALPHISENLKIKELRAINYNRLTKKILYPMYHAFIGKDKNFTTSRAFNQEIDTISLNNAEDYFHSLEYRSIVATYINKKAVETKVDGKMVNTIDLMNTCATIEDETIRNVQLYQELSRRLIHDKNKDEVLSVYLNLSSNDKYINKAKILYEKISMLDPGKPSPKFVNYENYNKGKTSLDDFKGNYVYIDIWASWCKPCIGQIPFLKELEKEYYDKNIMFVSISVDALKDKEKWKSIIESEALDGIQLFADKSFNSDFIRKFKINSIPRFILIDPDGNIVNANAVRPSEASIRSLFDTLLTERENT